MFKEGDEVVLYLDEVIEENSKKRAKYNHLLKFWNAINGKKGVIIEVISDDEIWVQGGRTGAIRMFTKATLRRKE